MQVQFHFAVLLYHRQDFLFCYLPATFYGWLLFLSAYPTPRVVLCKETPPLYHNGYDMCLLNFLMWSEGGWIEELNKTGIERPFNLMLAMLQMKRRTMGYKML